jgi:hypothetical protein
MLFLNAFAVSNCNAIFEISSGMMLMASGKLKTKAVSDFVHALPLASDKPPVTVKCMIGNNPNFMNRIHVDRASSGSNPCVKKPVKPCAFLKLISSSNVDNCCAPEFVICNARTKSNGYIIAAVKNADAKTGKIELA